PELVDRRQAAQLPVRHPDGLGDQARTARSAPPRRDVHGRHARLLGLARPRRGSRDVGYVRLDELRQGPAGTARARLPWRRARSVPQRPGRREGVTEVLDLAERALELAGTDEAEVVVTGERSGFARFAAGEVHQPTLIDDVVVQLRVVSDGRAGTAV